MANIIDTTGKNVTTATKDVDNQFSGFIFTSSLEMDELTTETIKLSIVRPNSPTPFEITNAEIPLKTFLMLNSLQASPITSTETQGTKMFVPLTNGGNIPLDGVATVKIELKGLISDEFYKLDSVSQFRIGEHIKQYSKVNVLADSEKVTIEAKNFDAVAFPITTDISEITLIDNQGNQSVFLPKELQELLECEHSVVSISKTGVAKTAFTGYYNLPLINILYIVIKKSLGTSPIFVFRNNVKNL